MGYKRPNCYTINIGHYSINPADSTVYYFGSRTYDYPFTSVTGYSRIIIPENGCIRKITLYQISAIVVGSAEDQIIEIRKNFATDYTVKTVSTAVDKRDFSNFDLNIPVAQNDSIEIKWTTPAWVTNPEGVRAFGLLYIETE